MKKRTIAAWLLIITAVAAHYLFDPWGFYWKVPEEEATAAAAANFNIKEY